MYSFITQSIVFILKVIKTVTIFSNVIGYDEPDL